MHRTAMIRSLEIGHKSGKSQGILKWKMSGNRERILPYKRGSCMVWEINMGVCPRLDFENSMLINCLGYKFNIYGVFEFLCNSIAN